jgi:hypothetical protein
MTAALSNSNISYGVYRPSVLLFKSYGVHSDATGAPLKFENEERMHFLVRGTRLFGPDEPYCSCSHHCCSELRPLCPNIVITAALKSELSSSDRFCSPQGTRYSCAPTVVRKGPTIESWQVWKRWTRMPISFNFPSNCLLLIDHRSRWLHWSPSWMPTAAAERSIPRWKETLECDYSVTQLLLHLS